MGDHNDLDFIAGPEAIIGIRTKALEKDSGAKLRPAQEYSVYLMFHWPWSQSGDIDSHSLFSFN
ncbi:MAG: hypothetical protein ACXVHL_35855 [Solirubrobacteraceae bacterium]